MKIRRAGREARELFRGNQAEKLQIFAVLGEIFQK
jgi:hypothetical protein